ncbi:MAG: efflux RND transporter permease subunit [Planctomycetes bacterium]|nr:efflux RND transporter permease subunit [Planctomycetota bacterium]
MGLIRFAIENPVKVTVAVILVCLFGILAIGQIPVQLTPDVDRPIVTVSTSWSGASPQEIESEIIDRQEEKLKGVSGLKKMTSVSRENVASVALEFHVGVDKDAAVRDVSEKLRQVSGYPIEVDEPTVTASDTDMSRTIAWLILYGGEGVAISKLKTFVEDKVKPIIERAEGVASTDVYGGRDREIQVVIDPYKLASKGLTFRDVERALRRQNTNISAGTIIQGKRDYTYRTVGEFTNLADVAATVIAYRRGGPVRVNDVAEVVDGFKKQFAFVRAKGHYVIAMPVRRETGANVLDTMANLKKQIAQVNAEILPTVHDSLRLVQVYDQTVYITSAIKLVRNNIVVGGALAIIILLVFLRSISATGVVTVAIPISILATFLVITLLGRSLNVVMLAGMAFAVGMVVDNAIVVLENIYRHRQMGKSRAVAALDGASEVWGAILASTLTTMAVFLPVIFIQEEAGQLFRDIAIAISSAVALSLLVSVFVIPTLSARVLSPGRKSRDGREEIWVVARWVAWIVARVNARTVSRLAVVAGLTTLSLVGSAWLMPATDYLPAGNQNLVFGFLFTPPGYSIEEFKRMAIVVEDGDPHDPWDGLSPSWEAELGSAEAAQLPPVDVPIGMGAGESLTVVPPPIKNFFFVSFGGGSFMGCTSKEPTNVAPLVQVMNRAGGRIPGVFTFFAQTSLFGRGAGGGNSIELEIRGDDHDKVIAAASALSRRIMAVGLRYPNPNPANFDLGRPEIQIIPDRERAADLGLDVRDIGFILEACVSGAFVGEFNDHGDKIDMALTVVGTHGASIRDIAQIPIYTPSGNVVPIASAVELKSTTAPQQINHIEEMDSVTLTINPPAGTALQTAMEMVRSDIIEPLRDSGAIDRSVITALAGNADKLTTTQRALIGDFRGTITGPRWFGLSIGQTLWCVFAAAVIVVLGFRMVSGFRPAGIAALVCTAAGVAGFLTINPDFSAMLLQSRGALALVITYLLMAALFESFAYPFVIMLSVPLAAVGGFAALRAVHEISLRDITTPIQQFDVVTMLGFVILIGIVVNNAILVVHQALNNMRVHQMPADQAIVESVRTRTRPIFMSALTSIFGMLPLVLMTGAGSELYRGLGSVVVGGLLFSTIFTLVVVPAMFSLFVEYAARLRRVPVGASDRVSSPITDRPDLPSGIAPQVQRSPDRT